MNTKTALSFIPRVLLVCLLLAVVVQARQPRISMYGGSSFSPSQDIKLSFYIAAGLANFRIEKIKDPLALLVKNPHKPDVRGASGKLVRHWQQKYAQQSYVDENIGRLASGVYKLRIESGGDNVETMLLVSNLGLLTKRSQDETLTFSASRSAGVARPSKVWVLDDTKQTSLKIMNNQISNNQGLAHFKTQNDKAIFLANFADDWALSDSQWNSYAQEKTKGFIYTDRPVYRPGQRVEFKGTLRQSATLAALANQKLSVQIDDAKGRQVFKTNLQTNDYGSFDAGFNLNDEPALGLYSITAKLNEQEFNSQFYVEAYQKPEYAVTVTTKKERVVQGEKTKLLVEAKYLFGGAVAGAKVNYYVTKAPYYAFSWDDEVYVYTDNENNRDYGADLVIQEEATLDANGHFEIELVTEKSDDIQSNGIVSYRVQAEVTDESRRSVAGNAQIIAYPSNVNVSAATGSYVYSAGENIEAKIVTTDLEDKAVAAKVVVELVQKEWMQVADNWQEKETIVVTKRLTTDALGHVTAKLLADKPGGYVVRARSTDAAGRISASEAFVWVIGSSRDSWYWNYNDIDVVLDKKTYAVGDTVTAIIGSPRVGADVLVTLESASGILKSQVLHSKASSLTYSFVVTAEMQPNISITASLMGNNNFYNHEKNVAVPKTNTKLNISLVPDNEKYKPRETGKLSIQVTDESGLGVPAELGLSVVDEAIYLLRPDSTLNINSFFNAPRGNVVGTNSSFGFYFESPNTMLARTPAPLTEAAFAQAKEQDKASASDNSVRRDFRDTIVWLPHLVTDENGLATVDVQYPDNLTTWRTTARGISQTGKTGQATSSTQTSKDLIARLSLPRFLIAGDTANLTAIVNNNSSSNATGELSLSVDGLVANGALKNNFDVAAGGRAKKDLSVTANTFGTAHVQAKATTALNSKVSDNDALELPLNVLPRGYKQSNGWAGGPEVHNFEIETDAELQTAKLQLFITPNLTAAVAPALEYLVGYPYGCTEQTMSRFLPALLAKQTLGANNLGASTVQELPKMIEQSINRLTNFQHEDGGWGFWQNDDSTLEMTAYVVQGLTRAKALGHPSENNVLAGGIKYLRQHSQDLKEPEGVRASAYRSLAIAGQPNLAAMNVLAKRKNLGAYALANLALAYQKIGETSLAKNTLARLINLRREAGRGLVYWPAAHRYDWWFYWEDNEVQVTALALEAIARIEPKNILSNQTAAWLLRKREGAQWFSTQDTASVIDAALAMNETRSLSSNNLSLELNGQKILSSQLDLDSRTHSLDVPSENLKIGQNSLRVVGDDNLIYSASLRYVRQPKSLAGNARAGLAVSRRYEKLVPHWNEKEKRYQYGRTNLLQNRQLAPVTVGDLLLVTLEVDARGTDPMRYLMISDPIPAGMQALDERNFAVTGTDWGNEEFDWGYWYAGRELRDDRVDVYAEYLWGNKQIVQYVMRAQTPGQFTALPAQAFLMYEPDVEGRSAALRITVRDKK